MERSRELRSTQDVISRRISVRLVERRVKPDASVLWLKRKDGVPFYNQSKKGWGKRS